MSAPRVAAPVCPYCAREAVLASHKAYGFKWECTPCDASVGCHKDTQRPKGTLANKATRAARIAAHEAFDPIWLEKLRRSPHRTKASVREGAYEWLARQLQLTKDECHIGRFDIAMCMRVVAVCAPILTALRRGRLDRHAR